MFLWVDPESPDDISKVRSALSRYAHIVQWFKWPYLSCTIARTLTILDTTFDRIIQFGRMLQPRRAYDNSEYQLFDQLFINLLHRCPQLQSLDYKHANLLGQWSEQAELFNATAQHPSPNLRVPCPYYLTIPIRSLMQLPPEDISLKYIHFTVDIRTMPPNTDTTLLYSLILTVLQRGAKLDMLGFAGASAGGDGSGNVYIGHPSGLPMKPYCPGLRHIQMLSLRGLRTYAQGLLDFKDMVERHLTLERISLHDINVVRVPSKNWLAGLAPEKIPKPWLRFVAKLPDIFALTSLLAIRDRRSPDIWKGERYIVGDPGQA
ncbi:hypothetical protein D9758_013408 [Tetrapyrgos nigripes]|uniref:Uncharacterized protein n=1 Tax=Tetrapyrgos nigripes TaxID=182062 RepID=A0A8H5FNF3_9AGAR|nr:hypothetical protein D9758_013408 [Tetrapyrgos nigripes]